MKIAFIENRNGMYDTRQSLLKSNKKNINHEIFQKENIPLYQKEPKGGLKEEKMKN